MWYILRNVFKHHERGINTALHVIKPFIFQVNLCAKKKKKKKQHWTEKQANSCKNNRKQNI